MRKFWKWNPPRGVEYADGQWHIDMDKFEPGMKPFRLEREDGVIHVSETCVRIETHAGNIHCHWRDGQLESLLRHIKVVAIQPDLQVVRHDRRALVHGYVLNWYLLPRGSLHVTFDAKGQLDEVLACGLETVVADDGSLTVVGVVNG